jgi:hypothetical protein
MTEMNDKQSLLAGRFEALKARDPGDWKAVRVRVRRMRRQRAAVVGAVTLATAVLAAPAFSIGERLADLIQGSPAPLEVQAYFVANDELRREMLARRADAGQELHDQFSPVIADEARGVFAIDAQQGPTYLWAAPTEDGRQCWLIQTGTRPATGRPFGTSSCDGTEESPAFSPGIIAWADLPNVVIVHVRVHDEAIARVDVEIDGRPAVALPVAAGHALGSVAKGERVSAFVGRNTEGDEVARFTVG